MVRRPLLVGLLLVGVAGVGSLDSTAARGPTTGVLQASVSLRGAHTFGVAPDTTHLALHWRGRPGARVSYALSRDGRHFGRARAVQLDEPAAGRGGETYGALIVATRVRSVRVVSDRSLPRLTLLQLADHGSQIGRVARVRLTAGVFPQPVVIARSGWGANESLRFDASGKEVWPAAFYPVQKVIVHHTATQNNDPDPASTLRSIYYYHAITQAWGDIGYNFLIDESGRIYEGRHSRFYAAGESPTGADLNGNGVTAAHAQGYNSGTVGIALLGTLTNQDATPAARSALEQLIAWVDSSHGIDPQGASLYTNPVSGLQATFANIGGHRDVGATECPGGTFYATLPTLRSQVAALLSSTAPDFALAASPSSQAVLQGQPATYSVTVTPSSGFTSQVSLSISGLPTGATASFTPTATASTSTLQITTATTTPAASYPLTITGTSGSLTHTTPATLVVSPLAPPDFTLAATPTSLTVSPGQTATYAITLAAVNGFTGSVNLTVTGLPSKTSATFTPNPASTTSKLVITTNRRSPTGTFPLLATGKSGALTQTVLITLTLR